MLGSDIPPFSSLFEKYLDCDEMIGEEMEEVIAEEIAQSIIAQKEQTFPWFEQDLSKFKGHLSPVTALKEEC
jgi:hypothetical protein